MDEVGRRLRAARQQAGLSLAAMAVRTHYSKALLGLVETGRRAVRAEHVQTYSRVLGVPLDSLYRGPTDPLRVAHEWLVNDPPARVHLRSGRRVGTGLADQLEQRIVELRLMDDSIGGRDLFPLVSRELAEAERVVAGGSYPEPISRRLFTVLGELAQLVGWVAGDAGRYPAAQAVYLSGVEAARRAANEPLAAQLLSSLSYQIANIGDPRDAVLLAKSSVRGARCATPVVRTLLMERVAWANARARDADSTRRALDTAGELYAGRHDTTRRDTGEPHWVYWMSSTEIDIMAGRCLVELGEPAAAAPLLASAIDNYDPDRAREAALYRTWLAESYLTTGDRDAARATLASARAASEEINSVRLRCRITDLDDRLSGR